MSATLIARLNVLLRELPAVREMDTYDYRRESWCRRKEDLLRAVQELDERNGDGVALPLGLSHLLPGDV
jgi:hypothetical protein